MDEPRLKKTSLQKLVNHETQTMFLVCQVIQRVILFDDLSAIYLAEDNHAEKTC